MASVADLSRDHLNLSRKIYAVAERIRLARTPSLARIRGESWRMRVDQEQVWVETLRRLSDQLFNTWNIDEATQHALAAWQLLDNEVPGPVSAAKRLWSLLAKEDSPPPPVPPPRALPPPAHEIQATLAAGFNQAAWEAGAVQVYLGLAVETSTLSGQQSLKAMGIQETFVWAQPRNMAQDRFAVRGSKIVQNLYGEHLEKLTDIIIRATDPRKPLPLDKVREQIRTEWPKLQQFQVDRIARTETAAVWTETSVNAYRANGITQYESIVAQGPQIGVNLADPCPICIEAAADGPFSVDSDLPPWHPNCRCEAIPVLEGPDGEEWLPPMEPWTGGGDPLEKAAPPVPRPAPVEPTGPSAYELQLERVRRRVGVVR